jgi:Lipocalin-like domain
MKRVISPAISALSSLLLSVGLFAGATGAQQKTLKEQLVGTWTYAGAVEEKDGKRIEQVGVSKGILVFDGNGRYLLMIMRSDLPKFATNARDQGTTEENKAVMQGLIAHFGTYSVNEADKTLTTRIEVSAFPNLNGTEQKRIIASLTEDELKYTNPGTARGTTAEVLWKRAK